MMAPALSNPPPTSAITHHNTVWVTQGGGGSKWLYNPYHIEDVQTGLKWGFGGLIELLARLCCRLHGDVKSSYGSGYWRLDKQPGGYCGHY